MMMHSVTAGRSRGWRAVAAACLLTLAVTSGGPAAASTVTGPSTGGDAKSQDLPRARLAGTVFEPGTWRSPVRSPGVVTLGMGRPWLSLGLEPAAGDQWVVPRRGRVLYVGPLEDDSAAVAVVILHAPHLYSVMTAQGTQVDRLRIFVGMEAEEGELLGEWPRPGGLLGWALISHFPEANPGSMAAKPIDEADFARDPRAAARTLARAYPLDVTGLLSMGMLQFELDRALIGNRNLSLRAAGVAGQASPFGAFAATPMAVQPVLVKPGWLTLEVVEKGLLTDTRSAQIVEAFAGRTTTVAVGRRPDGTAGVLTSRAIDAERFGGFLAHLDKASAPEATAVTAAPVVATAPAQQTPAAPAPAATPARPPSPPPSPSPIQAQTPLPPAGPAVSAPAVVSPPQDTQRAAAEERRRLDLEERERQLLAQLREREAQAVAERQQREALEARLRAAQPQINPDHLRKRTALVIGNARYTTRPLRNPENDANDVSQALKESGFDVLDVRNASLADMRRAVREFGDRLMGSDVGLVYYSGHGVEVKGRNYFIPVNADIQREDEVADQGLDAALILEKMSSAKKTVNILIVDACRDDPFGRSFRSSSVGLAAMEAPRGTLIAYSTSPGRVAADGDGRNSPYTKHLVQAMQVPNRPIEQVFKDVRRAVQAETREQQTPWENTSLSGDFYFRVRLP